MPEPLPRYEEDFFAWTQATAQAIRAGQRDGLEWEAIAEELDSLGKHDRREVQSQLDILCAVLLRWHTETLPH